MVKLLGYNGRYDLGDKTFSPILWIEVYNVLPNIICTSFIMTLLYIIISQNKKK